jgi:hypothetical protein
LNFVLEDSRRISRRLGRDDKLKLDEYLDAVDTMESRVRFLDKHPQHPTVTLLASGAVQRPTTPQSFGQHLSVMLDLLVLAFRCDAVRSATVMMANDTSQQVFPLESGFTEPHHTVSHHQSNPVKIRQYQWINRWYVQQFADLLHRLQQIPEGGGTLLDYCLLAFGSGMSDGNQHDPDDLPIVLAGGKKSGVPGGTQTVFSDQTKPLCNLYLSILNRMQVNDSTFGDSTGLLF